MKIAVIGNLVKARALFGRTAYKNKPVYHCAEAIRVTGTLSSACPPDWIIIEGNAVTKEGIELIQSLRAMGFSQQAVGSDQGNGTAMVGSCGQYRCGIEQDEQGVLHLHCGMHKEHGHSCRKANAANTSMATESTTSVLQFEYQAPPRRRNN